MSKAKILSGRDTALSVYNELNKRIVLLADKGIRPGLCVILIGDDPASQIYVRTKTKKLKSLGLLSGLCRVNTYPTFVFMCHIFSVFFQMCVSTFVFHTLTI